MTTYKLKEVSGGAKGRPPGAPQEGTKPQGALLGWVFHLWKRLTVPSPPS